MDGCLLRDLCSLDAQFVGRECGRLAAAESTGRRSRRLQLAVLCRAAFMVILAANLWVPAIGPVFLGVRWVSLFLVALLLSLLIGVVMSSASLDAEDVSDWG